MAAMLAEAPRWVWLEWASWPVTVTLKVAMPLCGDLGDQVRRAEAADLFVIGERQVHGPFQGRGDKARRGGQRQGQKALHIASPAPIEFVTLPG
jgi:hypothetical protein